MVKDKTQYSTFGDKIGGGKFYPDLPRLPLNKILNSPYLIKDATIVREFKGKFGKSDFALMLMVNLETGEEFTTLCGGMVVVEKVQRAIDEGLLPLIGTIGKLVSEGNNEYYIIS